MFHQSALYVAETYAMYGYASFHIIIQGSITVHPLVMEGYKSSKMFSDSILEGTLFFKIFWEGMPTASPSLSMLYA